MIRQSIISKLIERMNGKAYDESGFEKEHKMQRRGTGQRVWRFVYNIIVVTSGMAIR